MIKRFLYLIVLLAFIPLVSSGEIGPRAHGHISAPNDRIGISFGNDPDDSVRIIMPAKPLQDTPNRKRIKEVPKPRPQAKPEKIARRPAARPAVRPPAEKPAARPAARPAAGTGARPQAKPARPGR